MGVKKSARQSLKRKGLAAGLGILLIILSAASAATKAEAIPTYEKPYVERCDIDFGCFPSPPPGPSSDCGESCVPALYPTVVVTGKVIDRLGTAVSAATVYWKYGRVTAGADGAYRIKVWADSSVYLVAHHPNFVWEAVTIDRPLTDSLEPIDFRLPYIHRPVATPTNVNNSPSKTSVLDVTSVAPDSEVQVLVQPHQLPHSQMSFVERDSSGVGRWTDSWALEPGLPDGRYFYESCLLKGTASGNCSTASEEERLSWTVLDSIVIDSKPPLIDGRSASPPDLGNVVGSAPLAIKVRDEGLSGVLSTGISFKLLDYDPNAQATSERTLAGAEVTYNGTWAVSSPVSFLPGHTYSFGVSVSDAAGNVASWSQLGLQEGGGYYALQADLTGTNASIGETECSVSDVNVFTQKRTATCENVNLHLDKSTVTLSGAKQGGTGFIEQWVSLDGAVVKIDIGGVDFEQLAYSHYDHNWSARKITTSFEGKAGLTPQTFEVSLSDTDIGTLTTQVPAEWTEDVKLSMPARAPFYTQLKSCANPSWDELCSADPLDNRYVVVLKDTVVDPSSVAAEHANYQGAEIRHIYKDALKGYSATFSRDVVSNNIKWDPRVSHVVRDAITQSHGDGSKSETTESGTTVVANNLESQNSFRRIGAERSASATNTANDIHIAILDSGIDSDHPDLAGPGAVAGLPSGNIAGGTLCALPLNAPQGLATYEDRVGSGTRVAGVVAALRNGSGVVGVAPQAKLWAIKVVDRDETQKGLLDTINGTIRPLGYDSYSLCGIDYVFRNSVGKGGPISVAYLGFEGASGPEGDCGPTDSDPVHKAICNSTTTGKVLFIAPAGDKSSRTYEGQEIHARSPGLYNEVLTVTNLVDTDGLPCGQGKKLNNDFPDDTFYTTSRYPTVNDVGHTVAAPGNGVRSTYLQGSIEVMPVGTAASAALTTGLVSLYMQSRLVQTGALPLPSATLAFFSRANEGTGVPAMEKRGSVLLGEMGALIDRADYESTCETNFPGEASSHTDPDKGVPDTQPKQDGPHVEPVIRGDWL